MIRDRGFMKSLLEQADHLGCSALVFTVDMPVPGTRYRDYRSGLAGAPGLKGSLRRTGQALLRPRWALDVGLLGRPHGLGNVAPVLGSKTGLEDFFAWMRGNFDPSVTWKDLEWVRAQLAAAAYPKGNPRSGGCARSCAPGSRRGYRIESRGPAVGWRAVARTRVARDCRRGGRSPDRPSRWGVRSGLDVVRLLALGARGVLLGRAWVYGLAAGGGRGVSMYWSSSLPK